MNCSNCRSVSFDEIERSDTEVLNFCILCTTASKSFFKNIYLTFSVNFHMFKAKAFQIGKKNSIF